MPEQANRRVDPDTARDVDCYSIAEFCRRHGISESFFFKLQARGDAPRTIAVGTRRLITREAARQWRRRRTEASPTAGKGTRRRFRAPAPRRVLLKGSPIGKMRSLRYAV